MSSRQLEVSANGQRVGVLREANDLWEFEYDAGWAASADAFPLSPALPCSTLRHMDGASQRPVQWYFDNLLPEEAMRDILAGEARLDAEDAFGLLAHYGLESAGSLVLTAAGESLPESAQGLRPLPLGELSRRIRELPRTSLTHDAPKRMSLAGAQHKMVIVMRDGVFYEPIGITPSTHILKPDHVAGHYPATVINEWFAMKLAKAAGLAVPEVWRRYVPEPVYIIERFDRMESEPVRRRHVIDTCQLLNKSRAFKYSAASLQTITAAIGCCRSKAVARIQLFRWVLFNCLIGNGDNHLKNLSFLVSAQGIELAPAYDLLSTAVYATRALDADGAMWPQVELAMPMGEVAMFSQLRRADVLAAGARLGLSAATVTRELDAMLQHLPVAAAVLLAAVEASLPEEIAASPDPVITQQNAAIELRLLRAIVNVILNNMVRQLQ